ncbi:excinuclease ABC subunit UvrA [Roseinatronobacter alkalisoli]|uniref:UvrABC system protein A n=1 Tax=Roseinatronobacter alkalisoli TaxID=3028235 RepID=A0ABT5TIZ7_9RHOB|nr:excinuclease ABC subunit UvrA [Roseinatronobacter sp. HJB301]MDD7973923.1 excinuclease ABC subunit UvrA [Roseinatronobacter sp. HJB301]
MSTGSSKGPNDREPHNCIVIRGARENNLKNIDVDIPRGKIVAFTGVSGSGKTSLVFDTIGAEAQRQLNDTFTMFQRNRLPRFGRPDVDLIANISTPVMISQKRIGGNARSTVGTYSDVYALMRLLFSRLGKPFAGYSNAFSFNDPEGMCPDCEGIGRRKLLDRKQFFDMDKSLNEGPFRHGPFGADGWYIKVYTQSGRFDNDKKLRDYSKDEWQELLYGSDHKVRIGSGASAHNTNYEGVIDKFKRLYVQRDTSELSPANRAAAEAFIVSRTCSTCHGARLNQKALASRINGLNIADMAQMECADLIAEIGRISGEVGVGLTGEIIPRLQQFVDMGLGYLTLARETSTLSGGESQRIKMLRHLNSSLIEVIYVLDEPSIGLHVRDVERLTDMLVHLRNKGNTVLVIEHDPDMIGNADHVIDIGPGAGQKGGEVIYAGSVDGLRHADTPTGKAMRVGLALKSKVRTPKGFLPLRNVTRNNLKNVDVDIPEQVLTVVTGVAGSGKSSLITGAFMDCHPEAVVIDQSAIGISSRATPATYSNIMDPIRDIFAKATKSSPSLFSFNSKGACPDCNGLGITYTDLAFLDPIKTVCVTCEGQRFRQDVLKKTVEGKSIGDVLDMSIIDAATFFDQSKVSAGLGALVDVGLSYLGLGQTLSSLSGGELQRLKLATKLYDPAQIYVLDEPTTGLHPQDTDRLIAILDRLVDQGSTVIVIEHNLAVVAQADWVIDLGPEAGRNGGKVVFNGLPSNLVDAEKSLTGQYLRKAVWTKSAILGR